MKKRLNCRQIDALINFYKEGCLTDLLTRYVEEHLETCPECRAKYFKQNINDEIVFENNLYDKQYETFKNNLSAYIDNELDDFENIKIKKIAISNPYARQDLEDIYNFKKTLHSAFEKTKNDLKTDYSKQTVRQITNETKGHIEPFYKLAAAFFLMLIFLMTGLFKLLHF